jgi:hypothetical protein
VGRRGDGEERGVRRGAKLLELDKHAINRVQVGYGVGATMDLIAKIGRMAGEDFFASGKAAERFGVADLASAQKQLDAINNDPEANAKLNKNNPKFDASLAAKRNRLIDAVAHYKAQAAKE